MSTRVARGGFRKTPRISVKVEKTKTKSSDELESISYDYDAAVSQSDLTGFFKKEDKKISMEDNRFSQDNNRKDNQKDYLQIEKSEDLQIKLGVPEIFKDFPETRKMVVESTDSVQSLCPKSEPVQKKTNEKLATTKCPKSSRIPRARFTVFPRLPLRSKAKKLATTRLASAKSKTAIASEARQVIPTTETKPPQKAEIKDRNLSDHTISVVVSAASKNALFEEKCSGIDADIEHEPDQGFTTSTDDSPRRINAADPSIATVLRTSNLSCSCRSCNDRRLSVSKYRVNSDVWMDSRSSPEVGRYSESGRTGRPKSRRLADISRSRGYLDFSTNESETEPTTDFSIYETQKRQQKKQILNELQSPVVPFAKPSIVSNPRMRIRPRSRFSFFNTLFDIVFWPFLFLRADQ